MNESSNQGPDPGRSRLVERGQRFYDENLKSKLEPSDVGRFVAIEPESQRYFLDDNGTAALHNPAQVVKNLFFRFGIYS